MCAIISIISLFIGIVTSNDTLIVASGLFAIGAEIAAKEKGESNA